MKSTATLLLALFLLTLAAATASEDAAAPPPGRIDGKVTLAGPDTPIHHATIVLLPSGRTAETGDDGLFSFANVPPGQYALLAHMHSLSDERKVVQVLSGQTAQVAFSLRLQPVREAITVTATGEHAEVMETFQSVLSKENYELTGKAAAPSLGDMLDGEAGVAKRSGGPGTGRPVIRGFDGDRVLVLQDGLRTGTLSSTSGDHGEPVDPSSIERVEVVRGPATLLYGSNAIGGVVNVLTEHHILHQHPHEGLRGSLSATGGTANAMGGGYGNFEFGKNDWIFYASGGGTRTGDYLTPLRRIENSATEMKQATGGVGRYSDKFSFNVGYGLQEGVYGVPVNPDEEDHDGEEDSHGIRSSVLARALNSTSLLAPTQEEEGEDHHGPVTLKWRRHNTRFHGIVKELGPFVEQLQLSAGYTDWNHTEMEGAEIGTRFFNKQLVYRGTFTQRRQGRLDGSFGFWGMTRRFNAEGAEAIAPKVSQNAFALFALEEVSLERVRLQFGGRLESNRYSPNGLPSRSFTGASASAGIFVPLWKDGAAVVNYMRSYRAPSLEELFNNGPHPGNAIFEIGNANLKRELSDGVDLAIRHRGRRIRLETNFYRYQMHDFVYFQPTGEENDGFPVAEYRQADARFTGAEARLEAALHSSLWLLLGFDAVDANLSESRQNLPRIPPTRGRLGFDYRFKGLSVRPELVLANRQWQIAPTETPTAGYALVNINASYTWASQHLMHTISANSFNLGDRLYRNHLSFIKAYAPEIGRGIRFTYTVNWF
ncbi:MAG: TonB-dependent receptor [Bryobacteraceae bacterium]|nr:TonB-dependent receptor [Bryobacteraceae bacterium]